MLKLRWKSLSLALVAIATLAASAAAQITTGTISGRIVDGSGNPVEGARVQVKSNATGVIRAVPSNSEGRYTVLGLESAEEYGVTAQKIGFAPVTKAGVTVTLGQTLKVDFTLTAQATQLQAVAVQGEVDAVITPSKNGIGTTIGESQISHLPSLNRNFTDFASTAPQVSSNGPGLSGGGQNNRYNNIQIDGSTEKDLFGLGSTGQPGGQAGGHSIGIESVKQYQILLSPYDVRYGNFSGLLINAITKSGTNQFSGSAYTYYRDSAGTRSAPYVGWSHQAQSGFSLGGPIIKDKVFFFVNPEWQSQGNPAAGQFVGGPFTATQIPLEADVTRVKNFLTPLGFQVGDGSRRADLNPLTNILLRLDFTDLPFNSTLMIRENYAHADQDIFSRTATSSTFSLTDNGYTFKSDKSAWVAQLKSALSNGNYNELYLGDTHIRDGRVTFVPANTPQVQVRTTTAVSVVTGAERSSQANQLDQDIYELTDNFTIPVGADHRITFGTQNQWYKVRNLFGQNKSGFWQFNSLDSLTGACATCGGNPLPFSYQVGVPAAAGTDGAVRFHQQTHALYVQDEWTPTSRLNISYGLRADVSIFPDKPPLNQGVLDTLHRNTSEMPSGNWQISPRVGFNWDMTGDSKNQMRGGWGIFTGQPAFVWLSNSYQNSGLSGFAQLTCNTAANKAPAFNQASVNTPPTACAASGLTAAAGSEIDLAAKNLKFPQSSRFSLGYDRDLGKGWVWTVEGMYTMGLNQLFYQNIALGGPQGVDAHGRVMYGPAPLQPVKVGGTYNPVTATASTTGYSRTQVYEISNESKDVAYQLTTGITRRFRNNFEGSLFYTYSRNRDVQSVTSSTSVSQFQFGKSYGTTAESAQDLGTSIFDVPHRLVGSMTYTFQQTGTDLSLIYIGESGQRIHYTYGGSSSGDLNGDGIGNDMIYVPKDVRNPAEITFANLTGFTIAQQQDALDKFITDHKCLNDQRGSIMGRNSCGEPFHHTFNFSLRQRVGGLLASVWKGARTSRLNDLTIQWDVFNVANLINNNWGLFESSGFAGATNLLSYSAKTAGSLITKDGTPAVPSFTFSPTFAFTSNQNVNSNYRMQFALRYAF